MRRVIRAQRPRDAYCSWGRHKVLSAHKFEHGTMCLECQMKIGEHVAQRSNHPELSVALRAHEHNKWVEARAQREAVAKIRAGSEAEGFVYYIRINGQIKIGYAADVTARMRNYPPGSDLLAVEPGTMRLERERHIQFATDLERGREWFTESPRLRKHIEGVVELRGDPSSLAYQYSQRGTG